MNRTGRHPLGRFMVLPLTPEDRSSLECMDGSPSRPWVKFACGLRHGRDASPLDERLVDVYAQNAAGRVVKRCLGECLALVDVLGDEESQRDRGVFARLLDGGSAAEAAGKSLGCDDPFVFYPLDVCLVNVCSHVCVPSLGQRPRLRFSCGGVDITCLTRIFSENLASGMRAYT